MHDFGFVRDERQSCLLPSYPPTSPRRHKHKNTRKNLSPTRQSPSRSVKEAEMRRVAGGGGGVSVVLHRHLRRWVTVATTTTHQQLRRQLHQKHHYPLPYLKQGSTVSVQSRLERTKLHIRSQWRDDGSVSLVQGVPARKGADDGCVGSARLIVTRTEPRRTSMGRDEEHVYIGLHAGAAASGDIAATAAQEGGVVAGDDLHDDAATALFTLTLDVPEKVNLDCNLTGAAGGSSVTIDGKIEGDVRLRVSSGGTISLKKVRGHTIDLEIVGPPSGEGLGGGTIFVSELLESQSLRIELPCPVRYRFRAKRIHANTMEVQIGSVDAGGDACGDMAEIIEGQRSSSPLSRPLLDADDSGAACDIGALYVVDNAHVWVRSHWLPPRDGFLGWTTAEEEEVESQAPIDRRRRQGRPPQPQAVRIKSHHGHVHVEASTRRPDHVNDITGETLPIVDLGGANGSCEVFCSPHPPSSGDGDDDGGDRSWTSCHVHFDSMARDGVSVVQAEAGRVHVTVDRKVEADVRMLSPPVWDNGSGDDRQGRVDMDTLILEDEEDVGNGTMADELRRMLSDLEDAATEAAPAASSSSSPPSEGDGGVKKPRIQVLTKAFTARDGHQWPAQGRHCEFVDGWVENTTSEPDSRFDRKVRGTGTGGADQQQLHGGGGGKIRLEGAHDQALKGFLQRPPPEGGSHPSSSSSSPPRALLAVCSPDGIVLESLSWLGNIARRYGLDETRERDDLGRQATRRGRLATGPKLRDEPPSD